MIEGKLCFVILTWNSESYLEACLDSVLKIAGQNGVILQIHDNGSSDGTCEILRTYREEHKDQVFVTFSSRNEGTTKPRNTAMRHVPPDTKWICVLDSDTQVNQEAVERLIRALLACPSAMLAAPRMWRQSGEEQMSCKRFPTVSGKIMKALPFSSLQARGRKKESYDFFPARKTGGEPPVSDDRTIYRVDYAISACWMLAAEVREKVGYLDEYYRYAPEDVDYCAAIWENGYEVLFVSDASIYHDTQRLSHRKVFSSVNKAHILGLCHYFHKYSYLNRPRIRTGSDT